VLLSSDSFSAEWSNACVEGSTLDRERAELPKHHDLALVAARIAHGVVCLLSALRFHRIGTQSPSEVWMAIDLKARKPRPDVPPIKIVRFSAVRSPPASSATSSRG